MPGYNGDGPLKTLAVFQRRCRKSDLRGAMLDEMFDAQEARQEKEGQLL